MHIMHASAITVVLFIVLSFAVYFSGSASAVFGQVYGTFVLVNMLSMRIYLLLHIICIDKLHYKR